MALGLERTRATRLVVSMRQPSLPPKPKARASILASCSSSAHLPRVKRTDVMGFHAVRAFTRRRPRATPSLGVLSRAERAHLLAPIEQLRAVGELPAQGSG